MKNDIKVLVENSLLEKLQKERALTSELRTRLEVRGKEFEKKIKHYKEQIELWQGKFHAVKHENNQLRKNSKFKVPTSFVLIHANGSLSIVESLEDFKNAVRENGFLSDDKESGYYDYNVQIERYLMENNS